MYQRAFMNYQLLAFLPMLEVSLQGSHHMRVVPRSARKISQAKACGVNSPHCDRLLPLMFVLLPTGVHAQLPLSIDALLMPQSTFTVSVQGQWQQSRLPVLAQRDLPSGAARLSLENATAEQGLTAVAARYGLAPRMELNARLTHRQTRWRYPGASAQHAEGYTADLGMSWLALPERGAPAVLLDVRADLVSRPAFPGLEQQWLDGLELGLTAYRSMDPVVLSVATRYRYQGDAGTAAIHVPGTHNLLLVPQVNFAVNANVTLVGGLSLQYRDIDSQRAADTQSRMATALRLGLGYAAGRQSTFFVNTHIVTSGANEGAGFDLEWLYRFQ